MPRANDDELFFEAQGVLLTGGAVMPEFCDFCGDPHPCKAHPPEFEDRSYEDEDLDLRGELRRRKRYR